MKTLFILTTAFMSASASAQIKPIATDADGNSAIGCYAKTSSADETREIVIYRNDPSLYNHWFFTSYRPAGELIAMIGEKTSTSQGLSLSPLDKEGAGSLPDNGETWTVPTPKNTILAAKGNLKGFFLIDQGNTFTGQYASSFDGDMTMICTNDVSTLKTWTKEVSRYEP